MLKIIIATFTFMIEILCLVLFRIPNEIQHEITFAKKVSGIIFCKAFLRLCTAFYRLDFVVVVILSLVLTKVKRLMCIFD